MNSTRARVLATVTEKEFQQAVVNAARRLGWLVYHPFDSRRSAPGFPDLVLVRGERLIFAELKAARGRLSADQSEWLHALDRVGVIDVGLWRPTDYDWIVDEVLR